MGRVDEMAREKPKILLNQAIEVCLLDGPVEQRLHQVNVCIRKLEDYRDEAPEELSQLQHISSLLASYQENLLSAS